MSLVPLSAVLDLHHKVVAFEARLALLESQRASLEALLDAIQALPAPYPVESYVLCSLTGTLAIQGACPIHGTTYCLKTYVPISLPRQPLPTAGEP